MLMVSYDKTLNIKIFPTDVNSTINDLFLCFKDNYFHATFILNKIVLGKGNTQNHKYLLFELIN